MNWQPIETAPHGELVILGWWIDAMPLISFDRSFIMEIDAASWGSKNHIGSCISHHSLATHWMPLPEPPHDPE